MNLLIVTNAAGEINTWVRPVVKAIVEESPGLKITCLLLFCQFASGQEIRLLKEIPGVDSVIPPKEYLQVLIKGQSFFGPKPQKGVVLHLGGDPIYSLLLSSRLGWRTAIYTYNPEMPLLKYFEKILILDRLGGERLLALGVKREKVEAVGDLIVDSVGRYLLTKEEFYQKYSLEAQGLIIGLLAGSRKEHIRFLLPFLLKVAASIKGRLPEAQFITRISPSIEEEFLKTIFASSFFEGSQAEVLDKDGKNILLTDEGLVVPIIQEDFEAMSICDVVLTIPGSNTGQLATLGVPMLVLVPLNAPEFIPLEGAAGLVDRIPLFGRSLKRLFIKGLNERISFTALPNIRAKRFIVPEIRGVLRHRDVVEKFILYLKGMDKEKTRKELQEIMGPKGASKRVAKIVLSMLN